MNYHPDFCQCPPDDCPGSSEKMATEEIWKEGTWMSEGIKEVQQRAEEKEGFFENLAGKEIPSEPQERTEAYKRMLKDDPLIQEFVGLGEEEGISKNLRSEGIPRDKAIENILTVYELYINDRCVGMDEIESAYREYEESLKALGVTEEEIRKLIPKFE